MSDELIELEEEEYTSATDGAGTFAASWACSNPTGTGWLAFWSPSCCTASLDAFFTYMNKSIIDQGISRESIPILLEYARSTVVCSWSRR